MVRIKGKEISIKPVTNSHDRRALQFLNKIHEVLSPHAPGEDDIDLEPQNGCFRRAPASVTWYMDYDMLFYSYGKANNYAENLQACWKVIAAFVEDLEEERISRDQFIKEFAEDEEIEEHRKKARETLGLEHNESDMAVIDARYKELAKKYHPDMEGGDIQHFKAINRAHKLLRRELQ